MKLFVSHMDALKLLCANFQFFSMQKSHFEKIETSKHISLENSQWLRFVYVSVFTFDFHAIAK